MFDHLDDPDGFRPTPEFRAAVRRRGARLRRRNRIAVAGTTMVGCFLLTVAGISVAVDRRLDRVDRVEVDSTDAVGAGEPFNVLVAGTDGQPGVEGIRSDTILVVRIFPGTAQAAVLALPRDLYVPIAGTGREDRINQAIAAGPDVLVATVEALGVPVDHYVSVDFDGMQAMVDAVGGVEVDFPVPMRDAATGLAVDRAGCTRLDGRGALALARGRRVEQYVDGAWRDDASGDLGRIGRQMLLGRILLATFNEVGGDPVELERLTRVFADHATVDDSLSNRDLLELARVVRGIEPGLVHDVGLAVEDRELDGGRVVLVFTGEPGPQLEVMNGTDADFPQPGVTEPEPGSHTIGTC
jgi:LCP family protein required for cell wall assembly